MVLPTFPAGRKARASELQAIVNQVNSLTFPGWTSWTPSWSAAGTAPSLGNGTLAGWYRRPADADLVDVVWRFVAGSTSTYGTSTWYHSMPITPSANSILRAVGSVYINDAGTLDKVGAMKIVDSTRVAYIATSGGVVTSTNPQTWATGDVILGAMSYEPE